MPLALVQIRALSLDSYFGQLETWSTGSDFDFPEVWLYDRCVDWDWIVRLKKAEIGLDQGYRRPTPRRLSAAEYLAAHTLWCLSFSENYLGFFPVTGQRQDFVLKRKEELISLELTLRLLERQHKISGLICTVASFLLKAPRHPLSLVQFDPDRLVRRDRFRGVGNPELVSWRAFFYRLWKTDCCQSIAKMAGSEGFLESLAKAAEASGVSLDKVWLYSGGSPSRQSAA